MRDRNRQHDYGEAAAARVALQIAIATIVGLAVVIAVVFMMARAARSADEEQRPTVRSSPPAASPDTARTATRPALGTRPVVRPPATPPTRQAVAARPAEQSVGEASRSNPPSATTSPVATREAMPPDPETSSRTEDESVRLRLDGLLFPSVEMDYRLGDRERGEALLQEIREQFVSIELGRETWARLAILAVLLDKPVEAEQFAVRARASGRIGDADLPTAYQELSIRLFLSRGKLTEALVAARRLMQATRGAPRARLLLAEVQAAQQNVAAMLETVAELGDGRGLTAADRLRMGRLWLASEQWERLRALLEVREPVPESLSAQRDFLRAVLLVHDETYSEALALFDYLLQRHGEDYDVRTWRGAALVLAGRMQEAVTALSHAEKFPTRPEAWHWRGVAAMRMSDAVAARRYFQTALTASPRYGPAWEALAAMALNDGELHTALQNLENAVQAGTRRPSVFLMLAIAHARLNKRDETISALRTALTLDPALAETAKQSAAIVRLIEPEEIDLLAAAPELPPDSPATAPATEPAREP